MTNASKALVEYYPGDICQACRRIPSSTFTEGKRFILFKGPQGFQELSASAASGCSLCKILLAKLKSDRWYNPDRRMPDRVLEKGVWMGRWPLRISFGHWDKNIDAHLITTTVDTSDRDADSISKLMSTVESNFDTARTWVKTCAREHPECQSNQSEPKPPTRLLDVTNSDKVILKPSSSLERRPRYCALSHCWGKDETKQPMLTTKDNLDAHLSGLLIQDLPPTFRDAVRVSQALEIPFLWIDSLCIIQKNPNTAELDTEIARMNEVYSNAVVTIAASDAENCTTGLFVRRILNPVRLRFSSTDTEEAQLTVVIRPSLEIDMMSRISQGHLQTRAWTFQERELSPRILHYTDNCLLWECRRSTASEFQPDMVSKEDLNRFSSYYGSSTRFLDASSHETEDRHNRWYGAVEHYSHRLLRYPIDKLPAYAGIAAEWQRLKPDDTYLAGLWQSNFLEGLTWYPAPNSISVERKLPPEDQPWPPQMPFKDVPSWSWAAVNGSVAHFGSEVHHWNAKLESAVVEPMNKNPYGVVKGGARVTLSGWSIKVIISESDHVDGRLVLTEGDGPKVYEKNWGSPRAYVEVYFDHDPHVLPDIELTLFQLGSGALVTSTVEPQACACGLALQRGRDPHQDDFYTRLGMFTAWGEEDWVKHRGRTTVVII